MKGNLRQKTKREATPARSRSHREELSARLDTVETWLAQRLPRSQIIDLAWTRWRVSTRQADRYIADAAARWRSSHEPEREACRHRNLATVDSGIAEAFKQNKLRDIAALVRLRAMLDGSLNTPPLPFADPPPAVDTPPASVSSMLRSLAELLHIEIEAGEIGAEERREMTDMLSALVVAMRAGTTQGEVSR